MTLKNKWKCTNLSCVVLCGLIEFDSCIA
uniref:Uncharacterized protein n=1 Tax=Anguilla anguilla TaxID=7936 RepID=A0A0E9S9V4_ANGAN